MDSKHRETLTELVAEERSITGGDTHVSRAIDAALAEIDALRGALREFVEYIYDEDTAPDHLLDAARALLTPALAFTAAELDAHYDAKQAERSPAPAAPEQPCAVCGGTGCIGGPGMLACLDCHGTGVRRG